MTCDRCVFRAIDDDNSSYCIKKEMNIKKDRIACEYYDHQSNYLPGGKRELTEAARKEIRKKYFEVYHEDS